MALELSWFWFWVFLSALLIVGEVFTAGFFLLPFGVGAAAGAVAAYFGMSAAGQWLLFLLVSVPLLLLVRRFADRVTEGAEPLQVAGDRAIGQVGLVLEAVRPHGLSGRVRIGREEWRAEADGEEEIPAGAEVEVLRVEGTHLVVQARAVPAPAGGEGGA